MEKELKNNNGEEEVYVNDHSLKDNNDEEVHLNDYKLKNINKEEIHTNDHPLVFHQNLEENLIDNHLLNEELKIKKKSTKSFDSKVDDMKDLGHKGVKKVSDFGKNAINVAENFTNKGIDFFSNRVHDVSKFHYRFKNRKRVDSIWGSTFNLGNFLFNFNIIT
jgi:hypothetical protein